VDAADVGEAMHKLERAQSDFGHDVGHDCTKDAALANASVVN